MLFRIFHLIYYKFIARHKNGHGIHSPFLFDLSCKVFTDKKNSSSDTLTEKIRSNYKKDKRIIKVQDYGTKKNRAIPVHKLYRRISIKRKHGRLLHRITLFLNPENILEMGTGLGISTLYISSATTKPVHSLDGCAESQKIAKQEFDKTEGNIILHNINLDAQLEQLMKKLAPIDFAYIDANHTERATLDYFFLICKHKAPGTCVVIHDIYLNTGMQKAWKNIIRHKDVTLSIDLFDMGMVFFNPDLTKQHVVMRY